MMVDDSSRTPPASEYVSRWAGAMENEQYDLALAVVDEGLQKATNDENAEAIAYYTNLKQYTQNLVKALTSHEERNIVTLNCSMCGKGEADGCILVAGADVVICDQCVKICVGVIDTQRRTQGKEFECSFCGKKESEVATLIAGPGVSICDGCCKICTEILARDSE